MEAYVNILLPLLLVGFTALAYQHPDDYPKIFNIVYYTLIASCVIMTVWDASSTTTYVKIYKYLDSNKTKEIEADLDSVRIPMEAYLFGLFFMIYACILLWLPFILKKKQ